MDLCLVLQYAIVLTGAESEKWTEEDRLLPKH